MFGPIEMAPHALFCLAWGAAIMDCWKGKIPNVLTVLGVTWGLTEAVINPLCPIGFLESLGGVFVGLVLFLWLFRWGVLGAGDVKLLMAIGAWVGVSEVIEVALFSLLLGGLWASALLIIQRRWMDFLRRSMLCVSTCFFGKKMSVSFSKSTFPFGLCLSLAALWTHQTHPLFYFYGVG